MGEFFFVYAKILYITLLYIIHIYEIWYAIHFPRYNPFMCRFGFSSLYRNICTFILDTQTFTITSDSPHFMRCSSPMNAPHVSNLPYCNPKSSQVKTMKMFFPFVSNRNIIPRGIVPRKKNVSKRKNILRCDCFFLEVWMENVYIRLFLVIDFSLQDIFEDRGNDFP